ncbi:MAG TPA: sigma-70 family RNA polymerase sigma factor [Bryobacteraceae bacterium]
MPEFSSEHITPLLKAAQNGARDAESRLIRRVYADLRRLAAGYLRRERPGQTLQPTALVHEAYIRLKKANNGEWNDRKHFFAIATRIMREILVDNARARKAEKRGGHALRIDVDQAYIAAGQRSVDILALDEALIKLEKLDPRQSMIVELRFFGGLPERDIAEILGVSERTVKREWQSARAWLFGQIRG